jgi:DNA-binding transcriptional ArsR family regulator
MRNKSKKGFSNNTCKVICFNEKLVKSIQRDMANEDELRSLSEFYKLLGNATRLKIIFALSKGELCVCDIANVLGLSIPATSQQLKLLRQRGLVKYRNDGRMAYYSLVKPKLFDVIKGDVTFIEKEHR